jgi:hypothetical protein
MTSIQNLGLAVAPLLVGKLLETAKQGDNPTLDQYLLTQYVQEMREAKE